MLTIFRGKYTEGAALQTFYFPSWDIAFLRWYGRTEKWGFHAVFRFWRYYLYVLYIYFPRPT